MTDYEVRDLNDEINKLLREKWHWENRIIELGGANYRRAAPQMVNPDGSVVPGMRGYKCVLSSRNHIPTLIVCLDISVEQRNYLV